MFKTMQTPQEFFKSVTDFYEKVPKTPDEAKVVFEKVQSVFKTEADNSQEMWKTYAKAAKGDATVNEITSANKKAAELLKATTFAGLVCVPGALFMLPAIVAKAKEYNVDLVPASVSKQFDI